jgi:hypothetical protein
MQGDAQQPALRSGVDREVEHRDRRASAHHALDTPTGLLEDEHVRGAEEGQVHRLREAARGATDGQVRIDQTRRGGLRLDRPSAGGHEREARRNEKRAYARARAE